MAPPVLPAIPVLQPTPDHLGQALILMVTVRTKVEAAQLVLAPPAPPVLVLVLVLAHLIILAMSPLFQTSAVPHRPRPQHLRLAQLDQLGKPMVDRTVMALTRITMGQTDRLGLIRILMDTVKMVEMVRMPFPQVLHQQPRLQLRLSRRTHISSLPLLSTLQRVTTQ